MNMQRAVPNVAVAGAGYWGVNHVRNYSQMGVLRAVCDTDALCLDRIAKLYPKLRIETNFNDLIHDPDIDAIVIATPAETHYRLARQAIDAGKDVLVEKPLTLDVADGERLVELAARRHAILMVGHLLEYHPAVLRLRELISSGALGDLRYIYSTRLNLGKVRREENILWSFAPHDIAIILRLIGQEPVTVSATGGAYLQAQIADVTLTHLEFRSGVRAHIFVSWLHPYKEQRLVVIGSRRMAVFDDVRADGKLMVYDQGVDFVDGLPVMRKNAGVPEQTEMYEPLRRQCEEFVACIKERRVPITDGCSGLRVLKVLDAAETSLRTGGQPLNLEGVASQQAE
jgi:UDP-2-acetamido-3-amino-2,3-dideoxy-glucuronate N-acetyltransferase